MFESGFLIFAVPAILAIIFFSWFARTPSTTLSDQDLPAVMTEASDAFAGHNLKIKAFDRAFSAHEFDYSVESLKHLDQGLERLREELPEQEDLRRDLSVVSHAGLKRLISCAGAYLGEVIRRNSPTEFEWCRFSDLPPDVQGSLGGEEDLSNFIVLLKSGNADVSLPLNRIGRYLINGPEDSTYVFACAMIAEGVDGN